MSDQAPAIGIIGGSGLYQMEGVEEPTEQRVPTPFGSPSDAVIGGKMHGRQVYFLPRHGRGHRILPHELNHPAPGNRSVDFFEAACRDFTHERLPMENRNSTSPAIVVGCRRHMRTSI